jgi:hypothetical protein
MIVLLVRRKKRERCGGEDRFLKMQIGPFIFYHSFNEIEK